MKWQQFLLLIIVVVAAVPLVARLQQEIPRLRLQKRMRPQDGCGAEPEEDALNIT